MAALHLAALQVAALRRQRALSVLPKTTESPSAAELVLASLIEAGHNLAPDEVVPTVAAHLSALGMGDVAVYLVDLDQRLLVPVAGGASPTETLEIDATGAGLAFRSKEVFEEQVETGTRLWVPLVDGADRVGVLGVTVPRTDADTVRRVRNVASISASLIVSKSSHGDHLVLARRQRDMDLAAEMRWSMLPPLTFTNDRVAVTGMLEPAYEIAGDAFDYAINGDLAHIAIIDAMGHGLEASRMANLAVGSYRHSRRRGLDLVETFTTMDRVVATHFGPERFVTGQLARLDLASGLLKWVNAGHPPPLLSREGQPISDLRCETSLPLGLGYVVAEVAEVSLEPGDSVLFLTDGVIEARAPDGSLFGRSRLGQLWRDAAVTGEIPAEILRRLCHSILDHQKGRLQDDATLLLVSWTGPR